MPSHARNVVVEYRKEDQQRSLHVRFVTAPPIGVGVEMCIETSRFGSGTKMLTDVDRKVVSTANKCGTAGKDKRGDPARIAQGFSSRTSAFRPQKQLGKRGVDLYSFPSSVL